MSYKLFKKQFIVLTLAVSFALSLGFSGETSVRAEPGYSVGQVRLTIGNNRRARRRWIRHHRTARYWRRHHHG